MLQEQVTEQGPDIHVEVCAHRHQHDEGDPTCAAAISYSGRVQALGWTLTKNFITHDGRIQTDRGSTCLIPTICDAAATVEHMMLERPDDVGVHGVRGVREISMILPAPAIAAAVHDAVGAWYNQLPLTPERVASGLPEWVA